MRTMMLLAVAVLVLSRSIGATPPESCVIYPVTVIDVERGEAIPGRAVVVDRGVISLVAEASSFVPDGRPRINGDGLYLIPGLIDSHVHYISPETYGPLFLAHGVTLVREMGQSTSSVVALREQLARGTLVGPEMICAGAIVDGNPPVWPFSEVCRTPEEARAAVQRLKQAGVDFIKVYSRLRPEVYRAAVEEARALGLAAVGHVPGAVSMAEALDAGQGSNEHLMGFDRVVDGLAPRDDAQADDRAGVFGTMLAWTKLGTIDRAALRRELSRFRPMTQTPTLVVMAGIGSIGEGDPDDDPRVLLVPEHIRAFWKSEMYSGGFSRIARTVLPHMREFVGELHRAGVPLLVGTDLGNPYVFAGSSVHDEMGHFAAAGIPAADVLRSATITPARFFGLDARLGSIAPGKAASMVLLGANPLESAANVSEIEGVFLRGRYHDRAALDELVEGVRRGIAAPAPKATSELRAEGETHARGTYALKFGQFDAGTEEFVLSRVADGHRFIAQSRPRGGGQRPFIVSASFTERGEFLEAEYRTLEGPELRVEYKRADGAISATAFGAEEAPQLQRLEMGPDAVAGLPAYAAELFTLRVLDLAPGESTTYRSIGFGFPSWRLSESDVAITREADAMFVRSDGVETLARRYTSTTRTEMGEFRFETWTNHAGIVLRTTITMPFGVLTAELK